jgi:hypothetical protein
MNFNEFARRIHLLKNESFFIYDGQYEELSESFFRSLQPHILFDAVVVHTDLKKINSIFMKVKNHLTEDGYFIVYTGEYSNYKFITNLFSGRYGTINYFYKQSFMFIQPNVFEEEKSTPITFNFDKTEYTQIFELYKNEKTPRKSVDV